MYTEYERRKQNGKCVTCGNDAAAGKVICEYCCIRARKRTADIRDNRYKSGLCTACGQRAHTANKKKCLQCLNAHRQYTAERRQAVIASGKCGTCGGSRQRPDTVQCYKCTLKGIARVNLKDESRWKEIGLKLFVDQNNRCVYSGRLLIPGKNASVDHIVPVSKGGTDDIDNLQWVDISINIMKNALSEEVFLAAVRDIAMHRQL